MWKQTHLRKGSRPFDKDLDCSSSVVENVDLEGVELEGNVQEKNRHGLTIGHMRLCLNMRDIFWRSMGRKVANTENLTKNCGTKLSGEKKRGKVYGLSNLKNDFNVQHHGKQDQEVERDYCEIGGGKRER
ncbi:hypothetical protein Hdeb2414_s0013g00416391 [Helianthus debilis subsp. tardiflorus]